MVNTGNPYALKKPKYHRIPPEIEARAAEMLCDRESLHQVHRVTNISRPYLTTLRDKLKAEGKIRAE